MSCARRSFSCFNFSMSFSLCVRSVSISSRGLSCDCSSNAMWASFSAIAATSASCLS
uniref:Secreted protein n=1 Tax=Ascaris lumbricoides TaxID=6252 RepID=A0A0M3I456_ASCLU